MHNFTACRVNLACMRVSERYGTLPCTEQFPIPVIVQEEHALTAFLVRVFQVCEKTCSQQTCSYLGECLKLQALPIGILVRARLRGLASPFTPFLTSMMSKKLCTINSRSSSYFCQVVCSDRTSKLYLMSEHSAMLHLCTCRFFCASYRVGQHGVFRS